jgi:hypothetical protein
LGVPASTDRAGSARPPAHGRTIDGDVKARLLGASWIIAFPIAGVIAGWLVPRHEPWASSAGVSAGRLAVIASVLAVGALASLILRVLHRRARTPSMPAEAPEPVRWLIMGWPLPLPKWRTRTAPGGS